jgi:hypothetical protein
MMTTRVERICKECCSGIECLSKQREVCFSGYEAQIDKSDEHFRLKNSKDKRKVRENITCIT